MWDSSTETWLLCETRQQNPVSCMEQLSGDLSFVWDSSVETQRNCLGILCYVASAWEFSTLLTTPGNSLRCCICLGILYLVVSALDFSTLLYLLGNSLPHGLFLGILFLVASVWEFSTLWPERSSFNPFPPGEFALHTVPLKKHF